MTELISKEKIQQQAIEAADRGDEPIVCQYLPETESSSIWRAAYFGRLYELSWEKTA